MRNLFFSFILLQILMVGNSSLAFAASSSAPQFIAKLYTEALGRAPDGGGFDYWTGYIRNSSCSIGSLQAVARYFFTSWEYQSISAGYNNANRIVTLYRALFSREPDQGGLDYWRGQLDGGVPFGNVMNAFLSSQEFNTIAAKACDPASPGYGFGARLFSYPVQGGDNLAIASPVIYGRVYTSDEVQKLMDWRLNQNSVVELEPNSVVMVTNPIGVYSGKTLRTAGSPGLSNYARMARFVRVRDFSGPMISTAGSKITNIWIDGGRGTALSSDDTRGEAINIRTSFIGDVVINVRSDNTAGTTTLMASGANNSGYCSGNTISSNLITAYSSRYQRINGRAAWADGLTVYCENAQITGNQIVDVTDAPIVLFSGYPGNRSQWTENGAQSSRVAGNKVFNAGNSAYWGIGFEPYRGFDPSYPYPRMFDGARIESNFINTSDMVHIVTPLFAGTQSLWADFVPGSCNTPPVPGENRRPGVSPFPCYISNNIFSGRAAIGIGLHGMNGVQISGNAVQLTGIPAPAVVSPTFRCTQSTLSQPVVCAPGSTSCPAGSINAQVFQACY